MLTLTYPQTPHVDPATSKCLRAAADARDDEYWERLLTLEMRLSAPTGHAKGWRNDELGSWFCYWVGVGGSMVGGCVRA